MKAPASTVLEQQGVGAATATAAANGDHPGEISYPKNGGGTSGSAIMSKLDAPTHDIYQINSDTQDR